MPLDGNPQRYEPLSGAPFDQVLRDLQVARTKIALGWMQHRQQSGDRYCTYGAIVSATTCNEDRTIAALRELRRAHPRRSLMRLLPAHAITHWNDHHRRTQQDVVELFDRAIAQRMAHRNSVGNRIRTFGLIGSGWQSERESDIWRPGNCRSTCNRRHRRGPTAC